jgi:hypothetical protein
MTFLENLTPLLMAAEKYAECTLHREAVNKGIRGFNIADAVITQKIAADALLAAAIEFAKWGK